jgi:hypothetical protein
MNILDLLLRYLLLDFVIILQLPSIGGMDIVTIDHHQHSVMVHMHIDFSFDQIIEFTQHIMGLKKHMVTQYVVLKILRML